MNTNIYIHIIVMTGILYFCGLILYFNLKEQIRQKLDHIQRLNIPRKMPGTFSLDLVIGALIRANQHDKDLISNLNWLLRLKNLDYTQDYEDRTITFSAKIQKDSSLQVEVLLSCPQTFDFLSKKLDQMGHGYYAGNFLIESWKSRYAD